MFSNVRSKGTEEEEGHEHAGADAGVLDT
jgi:hypothetical protein